MKQTKVLPAGDQSPIWTRAPATPTQKAFTCALWQVSLRLGAEWLITAEESLLQLAPARQRAGDV